MSSDNEHESNEEVEAALRDAAHHWEATAPEPPPFPQLLAAEPDVDADAQIISLGDTAAAKAGSQPAERNGWLIAAVLLAVVGVGLSLLIPRGGEPDTVALSDPTATAEVAEIQDASNRTMEERHDFLEDAVDPDIFDIDALTYLKLTKNRFRIEACMDEAGVPYVGIPALKTTDEFGVKTIDRTTATSTYLETFDRCADRPAANTLGTLCPDDAKRQAAAFTYAAADDETPVGVALRFGVPLQVLAAQHDIEDVSEWSETGLEFQVPFEKCEDSFVQTLLGPDELFEERLPFNAWPGFEPLRFASDIDRSDIATVARVYLHDAWPAHIDAGFELGEPVIFPPESDGTQWGYVPWTGPEDNAIWNGQPKVERTGRLWLRDENQADTPVWEPFFAIDSDIWLGAALNRGSGARGQLAVPNPPYVGMDFNSESYAGEFRLRISGQGDAFTAFNQTVLLDSAAPLDIAVVIEHEDPVVWELIFSDLEELVGVKWLEGPVSDADFREIGLLGLNGILGGLGIAPVKEVNHAALVTIDVDMEDVGVWGVSGLLSDLSEIEEVVRIGVYPQWDDMAAE